MGRRTVVPLLFAPLILVATELAHGLAYRLVYSDPQVRASTLERTGHEYLAHGADALLAAFVAVLVALVLRVGETRSGTTARISVRAWWFAPLPPLVFALQEHVERLVQTGAVPWSAALEPTFLVGFVLQLPFGLLAYALGRFLLRAAERLGCALARRRPRFSPACTLVARSPAPAPLRLPVLALSRASRAPPFLA